VMAAIRTAVFMRLNMCRDSNAPGKIGMLPFRGEPVGIQAA